MATSNKFFTPAKISNNLRETPEGFLLCCDVAIARAGDLLYSADETDIEPGEGGLVILSRTIEELSTKEALASFEGKPVVIGHPVDENGQNVFVNPDNWSDFAVGITQNVRRGKDENADKILADLLITDREAIDKIISKELREISGGYSSKTVQVSKGFGIQKDFRGNHNALVESGRNGVECAIFDQAIKPNRGSKMNLKRKFIKILGRTFDEMPEFEKDDDKKDDEIMKMLARINDRLEKLERKEDDDVDYEDRRHRDKKSRHRDEDYEDRRHRDEDYEDRRHRDKKSRHRDEDYEDEECDYKDNDMSEMLVDTFERDKEENMPVQDRRRSRDSRRMKDRRRSHDSRRMKDRRMRDDSEGEEDILDRLDTMEDAIVHLLEKIHGKNNESNELESEGRDDDEIGLTVDANTLSKAEILAPGIRKSKDIKRKALQHAYKTEEGRKAINSVLDGKTFDSADTGLLFSAAAEVLKTQRRDTVNATRFSAPETVSRNNMSPQDLNAINAKRWESK